MRGTRKERREYRNERDRKKGGRARERAYMRAINSIKNEQSTKIEPARNEKHHDKRPCNRRMVMLQRVMLPESEGETRGKSPRIDSRRVDLHRLIER